MRLCNSLAQAACLMESRINTNTCMSQNLNLYKPRASKRRKVELHDHFSRLVHNFKEEKTVYI